MRFFYRLSTFLVRALARIIFRIKIFQRENIPPKGPFILACNHISYYDPPLVGSFLYQEIHFMAKKELFRNRLFGALISYFHAHPINRRGFDKAAIDMAIDVLKSEGGIIIFPEGTRAKEGVFLPPRPGIGMIAAMSGAPVIPAYIHGSNRLSACLMGKETLGIIYGRAMAGEKIASYAKEKDGYRRLAEDIMNRIKDLKTEFYNKVKKD